MENLYTVSIFGIDVMYIITYTLAFTYIALLFNKWKQQKQERLQREYTNHYIRKGFNNHFQSNQYEEIIDVEIK